MASLDKLEGEALEDTVLFIVVLIALLAFGAVGAAGEVGSILKWIVALLQRLINWLNHLLTFGGGGGGGRGLFGNGPGNGRASTADSDYNPYDPTSPDDAQVHTGSSSGVWGGETYDPNIIESDAPEDDYSGAPDDGSGGLSGGANQNASRLSGRGY